MAATTAAGTEAVGAASPEPIAHGADGPPHEAVRAAAAELFERHGATVEAVCRRMLFDASEAQDAIQQTFLAAFQALLAGTEPRDAGAWLATIARNECLRRIRLGGSRPLALVEEPEDIAADVHEQAAAHVSATLLWREIADLPQSQRDAVVLREFGGRSYDQVAAELGVSTAAVESLLFRARAQLRGRLRAVLATLNLAPLGSAAARLLGGEIAPRAAAPLVAKGVAVTAGLAVLGGGAVATERHLDAPSRHCSLR